MGRSLTTASTGTSPGSWPSFRADERRPDCRDCPAAFGESLQPEGCRVDATARRAVLTGFPSGLDVYAIDANRWRAREADRVASCFVLDLYALHDGLDSLRKEHGAHEALGVLVVGATS